MAGGMGGGSKAMPSAPDFTQAALTQGMISRDLNREQTWGNRPDQITPWGSTTWEVSGGQGAPSWAGGGSGAMQASGSGGGGAAAGASGGPSIPDSFGGLMDGFGGVGGVAGAGAGGPSDYTPERWTQRTTLSPEQQAIFDAQQQTQQGRADLGNKLLGNASGELSNPVNFGGLPAVGNGMEARNRAEDAIYGRMTSRLDPQWNQREDQQNTRLYNMGLREGDSAFDQQAGNFARDRNDAYQGAMDTAIAGGGQEMSRQFGQEMQGRQQGIDEMLRRRGTTLNEFLGLSGGQPVGLPQAPSFMGGGVGQTPNLLGAAGQQYGANLDQYNAGQAQLQGLMSGGMALAPFLFSDERLKTNIRRLDVEALPGVPYASWEWKTGGRGFGVIAQDVEKVRPDLVKRDEATGYLMVNMNGIGGER